MSDAARTTIPQPSTIRHASRSAEAVIAQYIHELSADAPVTAAMSGSRAILVGRSLAG